MFLLHGKRVLTLLAFLTIFSAVFAEDAPVYDVDSYPPQFDGQPVADNTPPPVVTSPAAKSEEDAPISLTQDQRLKRLEQQMKNLSHSDSASKLETAQTEIQTLRGQVEELTHQLQQSQNQQRLMYAELDKRLSQPTAEKKAPAAAPDLDDSLSTSTKKATPPAASTVHASNTKKTTPTPVVVPVKKEVAAVDQPNVAEEQQFYQNAYDLIKAKKYNEAVNTLQKMLQKYPTGQFAANAHYWLGELYGLLNKNEQSAQEFATVVKSYPESSKIADAQLKLGLIYAAQFKWPDAKAAFKKVIANYPGTASARLAAEQLKQLKQSQSESASLNKSPSKHDA